MLDLDRVAPQIERMAHAQAGERARVAGRVEAALSQWRAAAAEPARFAHLPRERHEPRLALPTYEPLDYFPTAPVPPTHYATIAVDGSQIEPDFHEIAPCYLINVGHALLRYGGDSGTRLRSEPRVFYPGQGSGLGQVPDWPEADPDELPFGTWGDLDAQRMLAEAEALTCLMREQGARSEAAIAFLDGPLIAWRLDWITPQAARQEASRNFLRSFTAAKATGIPLVGYISRTRSTDLINLLKISACDTAVATGSFCAACTAGFRNPSSTPTRNGAQSGSPSSPGQPSHAAVSRTPGRKATIDRVSCSAAFEGLIDRQLLERLLPEPGMRSPVFQSNSSVLAHLYGEHRSVGFFFINAGGEIGRVELPQWVWEEPERLALVHSLVYDQITLGWGYPIAISEAHEQAVVSPGERALFFDLIRRAYGRHDFAAELSAKALRKRGPIG